MPQPSTQRIPLVRLYDEGGEDLIRSEHAVDKVSLLPAEIGEPHPGQRLRIMWGQDLLSDLLDGRYRTVVCGVNDTDNTHGVIAQLVDLVRTSQWTARSITSYAKMFQESVGVHAAQDKEPYVIKIDLDSILILGLLRPRGRDHFTTDDLARGFSTVSKMLQGRPDRAPVASVSFLNARANRLVDTHAAGGPREPSFESVLRTIYNAGFRGDVYPAPEAWKFAHVGVFPTYPFPDSLDNMRRGGH
jgi:hypothetical protein